MLQQVKSMLWCESSYYDAYPNHSLSFLEYKETIEDAIKDADIISLHVPANKDSFHLFDNNMFKKLKGAVLVNAAREH